MTNEELVQIATDAYEYIRDSTTSPRDGAQVILMLHVILWLNHRDDTTPVETMLAEYNQNFITNFKRNLSRSLDA